MNEFSFLRNSLTLAVTSLVIVFLLMISFIVVHDTNKPRTHDLTVGASGNFASRFFINPRSDERGIVVRGKYQQRQEGSVLQAQTSTATLTCSPTSLTLTTTEQRVTATFRNRNGQAIKGRKIIWRSSLSDNRINILNPSSETNAQGVVGTRIKARKKRFEGSIGTVTALVDNNRDIKCKISLVKAAEDSEEEAEEAEEGTAVEEEEETVVEEVEEDNASQDDGSEDSTDNTTSGSTADDTESSSSSSEDEEELAHEDPGNLGKRETRLAFTVYLHGIGNGGDNQGKGAGNKNPLTKTIPVTIDILKASNLHIGKTVKVNFTYNPATGSYEAITDVKELPEGNYHFRIKAKKYLEAISRPHVTTKYDKKTDVPVVYLESGDINDDGQRNILDYNILSDCYSDLAPAKDCDDEQKEQADITDDGPVNVYDLNLFLRELFK
ncbi:MAG: hypothetical protein HY431_00375 [Candidatus Levybacteria bacterium]|nr:hypothetical protein [Candidatus Levybacteria bacterium]